MKVAGFTALGILGMLAVAAACSSSDDVTMPVVPSGGTSSGDFPLDAGPAGSGPISGSSSGAPTETVSCPSGTADGACTLPADAEGVRATGAFVTTDATCKTSVYVSAGAVGESKLRRYTVKTLAPCVLERDATLAEVATGYFVAADDGGTAYTAEAVVSKIAAGAKVACTGGAPTDGFEASALTMAHDGSAGFVAWQKSSGGDVVDRRIDKITPTPDGCTVATFTTTGGTPLGGITGLVIDTKGRLHVGDDTFLGGNKRVVIYGADGAFVSAYTLESQEASFLSVTSLTACKGGLCIDDFSNVVGVDENGVPRKASPYSPSQALGGFFALFGTVRGPLFTVGSRNDAPAIVVDLMADR